MAATVFMTWQLTVLLLLAGVHVRCYSAVNMKISPEQFLKGVDEEVQISCVPGGGSEIKEIVLMQIHKDDERKPLVVIHRLKKASLNQGLDATRFVADGRIDDANVNQSYLNLTVLRPDVDDAGEYSCVMFYLDVDQLFLDQRNHKNLSLLNIDSSTPNAIFNKRLSALKNYLIKMIKKAGDKACNKTQTTQWNNKIDVLQKKIKDQNDELEKLKDKDNAITKRVEDLENEARNQTQKIEDLNDKVSYSVAFSVTNNQSHVSTSSNNVLILPDVIMRQGQGYDEATGTFTAPRDGLYAFHVVIFANGGCDLDLDLHSNERVLARVQAYDTDHYDQSAISSVVDLVKGDKVFTITKDSGCMLLSNQYTVFTGYLVRPF